MVGSCTSRIITVLQEQSDTFGQLSNWSRYPIWLWFFIVGTPGTTCHVNYAWMFGQKSHYQWDRVSLCVVKIGIPKLIIADHTEDRLSNTLLIDHASQLPKHLHTQIARKPRTTSCWYICTSVNCGYVVLFYTCLKNKLFWKKYTLVSQSRFGITTVLIFKHSFANLTIASSYSYSLLSADIFQKLSHFQDPLAWKGYNSKQRTLPIKCQN